MDQLEIFLRLSFCGLSILISIISLLSLRKIKEIKIAFASLGFLIFAIEGILVTVGIFVPAVETLITTKVLIGSSLLALLFFYLSLLKR